MIRTCSRGFAALMATCTCCLSTAHAQTSSAASNPPVAEYIVAILAVLLVVFVVCLPSRKQF